MSADGVAFVDHTPVKNSAYIPSDGSPTTGSSGVTILGGDAAADDDIPTSFLGKVSYHYNALKAYKDERFKTLKPWGEFFDRSKFSAPGKMEAFSRANKNISHFYSNYVILATISSLYVLLINPSFLMCLFVSLGLYYYLRLKTNANEPLIVLGKDISYTQAWASLIVFTILSFYFTGGSSTVFWLVLSSLGTVLSHAMFREPASEETSPLGFASYI